MKLPLLLQSLWWHVVSLYGCYMLRFPTTWLQISNSNLCLILNMMQNLRSMWILLLLCHAMVSVILLSLTELLNKFNEWKSSMRNYHLEKRRDLWISVAYFMVARSERLTVGDQLCQSTVTATSTISAISKMLCYVMWWCQSPVETESCMQWTVCQD